MMKIRVKEVGSALHPSEVVVAVTTISGTENLVLDRRSVTNGAISVGQAIRQQDGNFLVELPRESQGGSWRVWVDSKQIAEQERLPA